MRSSEAVQLAMSLVMSDVLFVCARSAPVWLPGSLPIMGGKGPAGLDAPAERARLTKGVRRTPLTAPAPAFPAVR